MDCGKKELIAQGCYYDRPAHDLIFLTHAEHTKLHMQGKKLSTAIRAKLSESHKGKLKGKPSWNKGRHLSDETRAKLSEANKGKHHTAATRAKLSESLKGRPSPMKGRPSPMKGKHHNDEAKSKMSEAARRQWQRLREASSC